MSLGYGRARALSNVVILPDDATHTRGAGRIAHYAADARTGCGSLTLDMDDLYRGYVDEETVRTDIRRFRRLIIRRPVKVRRKVLTEIGVRGVRAFGVDYSGACGAPGLVAVVDRITGGKKKVWCLNLPWSTGRDRRRRGQRPGKVRIEGDTFTIDYGNASLTATFVSPPGVQIRHVNQPITVAGVGKSGRYTMEWDLNAIHASGGDPTDGRFFVLMTLQRDKAPAVQIAGSGLAAAATVSAGGAGKRTVSFDGTKVVFR
jgi:hypothetical protein